MKKLLTISVAIMFAFGSVRAEDNFDIQIQLLDNEIERLTAEKQRQFSDLDRCASRVSGFRIAGISLLGLTAVGIGVNVYQRVQINRADFERCELERMRRPNPDTFKCDWDNSRNRWNIIVAPIEVEVPTQQPQQMAQSNNVAELDVSVASAEENLGRVRTGTNVLAERARAVPTTELDSDITNLRGRTDETDTQMLAPLRNESVFLRTAVLEAEELNRRIAQANAQLVQLDARITELFATLNGLTARLNNMGGQSDVPPPPTTVNSADDMCRVLGYTGSRPTSGNLRDFEDGTCRIVAICTGPTSTANCGTRGVLSAQHSSGFRHYQQNDCNIIDRNSTCVRRTQQATTPTTTPGVQQPCSDAQIARFNQVIRDANSRGMNTQTFLSNLNSANLGCEEMISTAEHVFLPGIASRGSQCMDFLRNRSSINGCRISDSDIQRVCNLSSLSERRVECDAAYLRGCPIVDGARRASESVGNTFGSGGGGAIAGTAPVVAAVAIDGAAMVAAHGVATAGATGTALVPTTTALAPALNTVTVASTGTTVMGAGLIAGGVVASTNLISASIRQNILRHCEQLP